MLIDENPWLGGAEAYNHSQISESNSWLNTVTRTLGSAQNVVTLTRTTVAGIYEHNTVIAAERVSDHQSQPSSGVPRQRLRIIRANQIILATGAIEQPLTFANNDRPGVMLASAIRGLANRFAVAAGRRIV